MIGWVWFIVELLPGFIPPIGCCVVWTPTCEIDCWWTWGVDDIDGVCGAELVLGFRLGADGVTPIVEALVGAIGVDTGGIGLGVFIIASFSSSVFKVSGSLGVASDETTVVSVDLLLCVSIWFFWLEISSTITSLINELFTEEEKVYYTICLFNGKTESTAFKKIGCSNKGLIPIKNSCIIKFACAFNLEVYKGQKLSDEDEEKFILEIQM